MTGGLIQLSSAIELVERLPLSAVTVVLLTAAWSFESQVAREAVRGARQLVDCGSLSVSYYEVPVSILQVHAEPATYAPGPLSPLFSSQPWRASLAAVNVTAGVPWFPCVRVFRGGKDAVIPSTHFDTFDPGAIANHVEQQCRLSRRELRALADSDGVEAVDREGEEGVSPLSRLGSFATPISRDRFARELTKDAFQSLGVLFLVRGGVKAIVETYRERWDAVARAIAAANTRKFEEQDLRKRWVVSIVDTVVDRDIAERNGVRCATEPVILLVDSIKDDHELHEIESGASWEQVSYKLQQFERGSGHQRRRSEKSQDTLVHALRDRSDVKGKILSYFEKPLLWRQHFSVECELCLKNVLENRFEEQCETESWVWVVVYQPWCGFCQRVLGCYRRLQMLLREANLDSYVIEVSELQELPDFLDDMVDGFPTVLRLRSEGLQQTVEEYAGSHRVEDVMMLLSEKDRQKMNKTLMSVS